MSATAVQAASPRAEPPVGRRANLDLWICWWSQPVFYALFGIMFVLLARVMPPPRPDQSAEQIVAFFDAHGLTIKIGFGMLMVVIGFASWGNGLVAVQMKRMSIGSVWAYAYIASLAVGVVPGCLLPAFSFLAAAFRPDRDPQILMLLYDVTFVMFVGSLGCFATQYLVLALAILLDKNQIFPKWFAYVTIWNVVTEVLAAPIFIFKDGPFAWDGSISFWQGTAIFAVYLSCLILLLRVAIQRQSVDEPVAVA